MNKRLAELIAWFRTNIVEYGIDTYMKMNRVWRAHEI